MNLNRYFFFFSVLLLSNFPVKSFAFDHSHVQWDALLKSSVTWVSDGSTTQVDYSVFKRDHDNLHQYLLALADVKTEQFDRWNRDQQLSFLINAYNAFTVELILTRYPNVSSIKDLGSFFSSPWKMKFFQLFGNEQSLDGIEHTLIRESGRYDEPLIHFAVNCASIGCPALRDEAFVETRLEEQLLDQTRRFVSDRSRNRFDVDSQSLFISRIFDWYEEDFEQGWRNYHSLKSFIAIHADWFSKDSEIQKRLNDGYFKIGFLPYDWQLNGKVSR